MSLTAQVRYVLHTHLPDTVSRSGPTKKAPRTAPARGIRMRSASSIKNKQRKRRKERAERGRKGRTSRVESSRVEPRCEKEHNLRRMVERSLMRDERAKRERTTLFLRASTFRSRFPSFESPCWISVIFSFSFSCAPLLNHPQRRIQRAFVLAFSIHRDCSLETFETCCFLRSIGQLFFREQNDTPRVLVAEDDKSLRVSGSLNWNWDEV